MTSNLIDTDVSNAKRLADLCAGKFLYLADTRGWLKWNGRCWVPGYQEEIEAIARQIATAVNDEAVAAVSDSQVSELRKHAKYCESRKGIDNAIKLLKSEPGISIVSSQLNSNKKLLTLSNGTLDLATGILHDHDPGHLITMCAGVNYDPDAVCPKFYDFMATVTGGDQALQVYMQQALGSCLGGDTSDQALFILLGDGKNGKSTLMATIELLLGDYCQQVNPEVFMGTKQSDPNAPNPQMAGLIGTRIVFGTEINKGQVLHEGIIKRITGGELITARALYGNPVRFKPDFKLFWSFNSPPVIRDVTESMWRRLKFIPFQVEIPAEDRIPEYELVLLDREAPGILNWLVKGFRAWESASGLDDPAAVVRLTTALRCESDTALAFVKECCQSVPGSQEPFSQIYARYEAWCLGYGLSPAKRITFGKRLDRLGFASVSGTGNVKFREGIKLMPMGTSEG